MEERQAHSYRATIEYDGTDYFGFQVQPDRPTVQGAIEAALAETIGDPVRITAAGRTDTGVHARGQVIGFTVHWRHTADDLLRAVDARLPQDIAVIGLGRAPAGFHPRYSARSRVYRYTVLNQEHRSPLRQRFAHRVGGALDMDEMNRGAAVLVGSHDFGSFGNPTQGEVTVRQVFRAKWVQQSQQFTFDIEGNGFLRRMVRTIVAALILLGQGSARVEDIMGMLAVPDRSSAPAPAPACGLCLMQVKY